LAPEWGWANPGTIVASGFQVVSTLGLYLSSDTDNANWEEYYNLHLLTSTLNTTVPHGRGFFNITDPTEISRVLGGEGCLWGEQTNGDVINVRLWPRAAVIAEALWSGPGGNTTEALPRLLRHCCRMRQRGVPVAPLQPGFC
jgi:hexosaminidase